MFLQMLLSTTLLSIGYLYPLSNITSSNSFSASNINESKLGFIVREDNSLVLDFGNTYSEFSSNIQPLIDSEVTILFTFNYGLNDDGVYYVYDLNNYYVDNTKFNSYVYADYTEKPNSIEELLSYKDEFGIIHNYGAFVAIQPYYSDDYGFTFYYGCADDGITDSKLDTTRKGLYFTFLPYGSNFNSKASAFVPFFTKFEQVFPTKLFDVDLPIVVDDYIFTNTGDFITSSLSLFNVRPTSFCFKNEFNLRNHASNNFKLSINFYDNAKYVDTMFGDPYKNGYDDGYIDGYDKGVIVGSETNKNLFSLLSQAFTPLSGILEYEIAPGFTIGLLLMVPLALGILLFIIKLITA